MPNRPYFKFTLENIKQLFNENLDNAEVLLAIHDELLNRKTKGARTLISMVLKAINDIKESTRTDEICTILLPNFWFKGKSLDEALKYSNSPFDDKYKRVVFSFPNKSKLILEASIRILCLANQLASMGKSVTLDFANKNALSYLNLMNFFIHLDKKINVLPSRPKENKYRGNIKSLVQLSEVAKDINTENLPKSLTDKLCEWANVDKDDTLAHTAFIVFGEMIDNILDHSKSKLNGFAALQVYEPKSNPRYIQITVSDSGLGITKTLRPTLHTHYPDLPELTDLSDTELILKIFEKGLSRRGPERGDGLKATWLQAMKSNTKLVIRQDTYAIRLKYNPATSSDNKYKTKIFRDLSPIQGTHISLEFYLDD